MSIHFWLPDSLTHALVSTYTVHPPGQRNRTERKRQGAAQRREAKASHGGHHRPKATPPRTAARVTATVHVLPPRAWSVVSATGSLLTVVMHRVARDDLHKVLLANHTDGPTIGAL